MCALKEAMGHAPNLSPYILAASALMSGGLEARTEALERLSKLARETVRTHPLASAALVRAVRDLSAELAGQLLEAALRRDPQALAAMMHGEDSAR